MIASHLELHRYGTGRGSRVVTALTLLKSHLFKYQGHVSAALVLGGVDLNGPHLFTVSPQFQLCIVEAHLAKCLLHSMAHCAVDIDASLVGHTYGLYFCRCTRMAQQTVCRTAQWVLGP